jgi:hypothetical protein
MTPPLDLAMPRTVTPGHDEQPTESVKPCVLRTWCLLGPGHEGSCVVVPYRDGERTEYGPRRKR